MARSGRDRNSEDRFEPSPWELSPIAGEQSGSSVPQEADPPGPPPAADASAAGDEPFVRVVQSSNPAEIAFLHGLFEGSGLPYRVLGFDLTGGDGTFVAGRSETFLVPEDHVADARDVLLEGIAEIPALRARVEADGEWDDPDATPYDSGWTAAISTMMFSGLIVTGLVLFFVAILRRID